MFRGWWYNGYQMISLNGKYGSKTSTSEGMSYYYTRKDGVSFKVKPKSSLIMFRIPPEN